VIASFGAYRKPKILAREFPAQKPAEAKKQKAA